MSSTPSTVDFILEQTAAAGAITAKKLFGEYGVFLEGKMVAMVCDDRLLVKPTAGGREFVGECPEAEPYPGAKKCLLIEGDKWDDAEWLSELMKTTARELPLPKKKAPPKAKKTK